MKPLIAIVSLYDEKLESYWMLPGYAQGLEDAGAAPANPSLTADQEILERYAQTFDGFLFPGGHDVDPALYGQTPSEQCGTICPQRDGMEAKFFPMALATGKPLLGVCRGIQLFNVMLGGDLYQDIPTQCPSDVEHHETPPYDKVAHQVRVEPGTPLHEIVGLTEMGVNSYHHQGIRNLGKGLKVAAKAPDGMVEAVYLPGSQVCSGGAVASGVFPVDRREQPEDFLRVCAGLRGRGLRNSAFFLGKVKK